MILVQPCFISNYHLDCLTFLLLFEQPIHKSGIIESRIPAPMIATGELNIFHICTGSFQCFYTLRENLSPELHRPHLRERYEISHPFGKLIADLD